MDSIDIGFSPSNKTPSGVATVQAVLSYCGKPFLWLDDGKWRRAYGWQPLERREFRGLGRRWLSACNVPDLALYPEQFPGIRSVRFRAGLKLGVWQRGLWTLAWVIRAGLVDDWSRSAALLKRISDWFNFLGTVDGGMFVELRGRGADGSRTLRAWHFTAPSGHEPEIPIVPAVVLATRMAAGEIPPAGAYACMNLITLEDFSSAVAHLDISWEVTDEDRPAA